MRLVSCLLLQSLIPVVARIERAVHILLVCDLACLYMNGVKLH